MKKEMVWRIGMPHSFIQMYRSAIYPLKLLLLLICNLLFASMLSAQNAVIPGTLSAPYPTIINLAVVWEISGDDNHNASAIVRYRKADSSVWHHGMPLRRIHADSSKGTRPIFHWKEKFSGSIFDLQEDTVYEIEITLNDPDGGGQVRTITARTRSVPHTPADATIKNATPENFAAITGKAERGDVILLAPGDYGIEVVYTDHDSHCLASSGQRSGFRKFFIERPQTCDCRRTDRER